MRLALILLVAAAAAQPVGQQPPDSLKALLARAGLNSTVAAWCSAEFRTGNAQDFAVALSSAEGGRYLALARDGSTSELAMFAGSADLSCYSRAAAVELDRSIRRSETIHGRVTPRWDSTVVCGFVEDTAAECWQYSPAERRFVRVGGWTT